MTYYSLNFYNLMTKVSHLLMVISILFADDLFAQPGSLDKSFGSNGIVITTIGPRDNAITSLAIQQDKKIVAAGFTYNGLNYDFALARYDTIGLLDLDFGTTGIVTIDIGQRDNCANSLVIQNDGKLVLTGYAFNGSYYDFALVRYNTSGSLDSTFGTDGVVITTFGEFSVINSSALADDGKIITVGCTGASISPGHNTFAMCRYNTDGTLDGTFGVGGKVLTAFDNVDDVATAVAIQKNGKIDVAGHSYNGLNPNIAIAQYNNDGTLDETFGTEGKVITSLGFPSYASSLVIQKDGRIVITGGSFDGSKFNFTLVRYDTDGTLDTSFGSNGIVTTTIGQGDNNARSVKLQSDEKILVAGYSPDNNSKYDFALVRYNTKGTLDSTFGTNGVVTTSITSFNDAALSLAIQNNGKIITAGAAHFNDSISSFAIVRYLSGLNIGIIDLQVIKNFFFVYPNPVDERATLEYILPGTSVISIHLIDLHGKIVKTFIDNQEQEAGRHLQTLILTGGLSTGSYYIVISTETGQVCIQIIKS